MAIDIGPRQPCPFCSYIAGEDQWVIVAEDERSIAFINERQYERGATLIVPRAHRETILEVSDEEIASAYRLAKRLAAAMVRGLGATGVSVFQNNGLKSGQSVAHYHVHVVPRYESSDPKRNFREANFDKTPLALQESVAGLIRAAL